MSDQIKKVFSRKSVSSIDEAARTIEFRASDQTVDRAGDRIFVNGWETEAYAKNPQFLWAHDTSKLPIGKCVELTKQTAGNPALIMKIQFATFEENPFAENVWKLYKGGYLNAVSVGFIPLEMVPRIDSETGYIQGADFVRQDLLELSAVPIGCNAAALALAMKPISTKGISTVAEFLKALLTPTPKIQKDEFDQLLSQLARK